MSAQEISLGAPVVLLYHRLGRPRLGSLVAGQYVAPRLFESQARYLSGHGWEQSSLADVVERRRSGEQFRDREFCITFDDGYLSVYDHACPRLAKLGWTATVYVVADCIGGINDWDRRAGDQEERMMSARQIRELSEAGFEIGSHTLTHPHLTELDNDQLRRELADSKRRLEDLIGTDVTSFSYPYGDYDARVIEEATAAGYTHAVSTRLGVVVSGTSMFEIPRVNVRWNAIGPLLMRKIGRARRASGLEQ